MRILLLGRRGEDHEAAAKALQAAGHQVVCCFSASNAWACTALNQPCPLDVYTDVVVALRQPGSEPYDSQGAVCARRRRVPIVAVGATRADAIRGVAAAIVTDPTTELVAACEELAGGESNAHTAAARRALADVVGPTERVEVTVTRGADGLHALLTTSVDERLQLDQLVERVRAALSGFDPAAPSITVSLDATDPTAVASQA